MEENKSIDVMNSSQMQTRQESKVSNRLQTLKSSMVKSEGSPQSLKQDREIVSIDPGIQIELRDEQLPNAHRSRTESLRPDANMMLERLTQFRKQHWETVSTDAGMDIDGSEEQPSNAKESRSVQR
jgi:hypothetical protein